jgi:hypothetical protein
VVDGREGLADVLRTTGGFFIFGAFGGVGGVGATDSIAAKYLSANAGSPAFVIRLVAVVSKMMARVVRIIAGLLNCRLWWWCAVECMSHAAGNCLYG